MHKSESTSDTSALSPSVGESAAITSNSKVDVSAESVFFTISVALSEKASASYDAESFIFVTLESTVFITAFAFDEVSTNDVYDGGSSSIFKRTF